MSASDSSSKTWISAFLLRLEGPVVLRGHMPSIGMCQEWPSGLGRDRGSPLQGRAEIFSQLVNCLWEFVLLQFSALGTCGQLQPAGCTGIIASSPDTGICFWSPDFGDARYVSILLLCCLFRLLYISLSAKSLGIPCRVLSTDVC